MNDRDTEISQLTAQIQALIPMTAPISKTLPQITNPIAIASTSKPVIQSTIMSNTPKSGSPPGSPLTKSHMRALYSLEERKQIPVFEGKRGKPLVHVWLEEAERVAQSSSWSSADKIKSFGDRLRGDAFDWHKTYIASAQLPDDYELWEKAFIDRFLTEADRENLKKELFKLKQGEQSTQTFVSRLNKLYDIVNRKEISIDLNRALNETKELYHSLYLIRSEEKKKLLIKGLPDDIKKIVWSRVDPDTVYDAVCELAYTAETLVNRMEKSEDKSLKATIAGMSAHDDEQDIELSRQQDQLTAIEKQLASLNLNTLPQEIGSSVAHSIAVTDAFNRHRSPSGDRRRPDSETRIRFQNPPAQATRDNNPDRNPQQYRGRDNQSFRPRSPGAAQYNNPSTSYPRRDATSPARSNNYENRQTERLPFRRPFDNPSPRYNQPRSSFPPYNNYQTRPQQTFYREQQPNSQYNFPPPTYLGARPRDNQAQGYRTQRITYCYACGKRGHFAREYRTCPPEERLQQTQQPPTQQH